MTCEIVYGTEGQSDFMELATPKEYKGIVKDRLPVITELLYYPSEPSITPRPAIFCYTKGEHCEAILSCIKWAKGRKGSYFAQHLVFEENDNQIDAGPAWLIKRREFYIETLNDWSERRKETENHDWKPIILPSNYCIGTGKEWGTHINKIIKNIADAWNGKNEQAKYVLLFDPEKPKDNDRLDLLVELYAQIGAAKRWNYQFCTFDGQRKQDLPKWDIVFVADDKTSQKYQSKGYKHFNLKGDE